MFFMKQFDPTNVKKSNYLESSLGWIGATIIGGGIALRNYMNSSGGAGLGYGGDDEGDSYVWFVTGVSFSLYALLATWLFIIDIPLSVMYLSLLASACSFIGLIMVSYFSSQSN